MKRFKLVLVLPVITALTTLLWSPCAQVAYAQSYPYANTGYQTITDYRVGWSGDDVRVMTTGTFVSNGCPGFSGSDPAYITNPADPGNHAYQAALLAAFVTGKKVSIWVQGCYQSRPQIIGVDVTNSL
jgi:hypothetical protein